MDVHVADNTAVPEVGTKVSDSHTGLQYGCGNDMPLPNVAVVASSSEILRLFAAYDSYLH